MQQLIQKKQEPKYMYKKTENRGGKRAASGRKKADYETKTIAFRVRVEFVERIKKLVKDAITEYNNL